VERYKFSTIVINQTTDSTKGSYIRSVMLDCMRRNLQIFIAIDYP